MMPALAVSLIQAAAQCRCASVTTIWRAGAGERDPLEPHADQRRQIAARDLRSASAPHEIQPAGATRAPARQSRRFALQVQAGVDGGGLPVGGFGAVCIASRLEQVSRLDQCRRIVRVELDRAPKMLEGAVGVACPPLELSQFAIEKRAVRRESRCARS